MEFRLFYLVTAITVSVVYGEVVKTKYRELAEGETIEVKVAETRKERSKLGCNTRYELYITGLVEYQHNIGIP